MVTTKSRLDSEIQWPDKRGVPRQLFIRALHSTDNYKKNTEKQEKDIKTLRYHFDYPVTGGNKGFTEMGQCSIHYCAYQAGGEEMQGSRQWQHRVNFKLCTASEPTSFPFQIYPKEIPRQLRQRLCLWISWHYCIYQQKTTTNIYAR